MIVDERMRTYINSLNTGNTDFLEELEQTALETGVPVIRREMQSFIKTLLAMKKPKRILEVGTAVGFSTLLMCEYGPSDLKITTIENYEKRIPIAKENFKKAEREEQITLLEGDAGEILKTLSGTYDFIFMDAAKGQYINWLPDILRLMAYQVVGTLIEWALVGDFYLAAQDFRIGIPGMLLQIFGGYALLKAIAKR